MSVRRSRIVKVAPPASFPVPAACDAGVKTVVSAVNWERAAVACPAAAGKFAIGSIRGRSCDLARQLSGTNAGELVSCVRGDPQRGVAQEEAENAVRVLRRRHKDVERCVAVCRHRQPQSAASLGIELRKHRRHRAVEPELGEHRAATDPWIAVHDPVSHGNHVVDRGAHVRRP